MDTRIAPLARKVIEQNQQQPFKDYFRIMSPEVAKELPDILQQDSHNPTVAVIR